MLNILTSYYSLQFIVSCTNLLLHIYLLCMNIIVKLDGVGSSIEYMAK